MGIVSYTVEELPRMTPERMARLKALSEKPDSEIDLTDPDAPEMTPEQLARMRPARLKIGFYKDPVEIT